MPDLDFSGLRADVEAATLVPEFDAVRRRARRLRLRDRIAVVLALLALGGVVTPVTLAALKGSPDSTSVLVGPDRPQTDPVPAPEGTSPMTATRFQATVRAVGGADLDHLYAAVDVCSAAPDGTTCDLQVSLVAASTDRQRSPVVIGQLRESAASPLTDVQLSPLTNRSLLLTGVPSTGTRRYARISVPQSSNDFAGGASEPKPDTYAGALSPGDRAVQLTENGDLYGVRAVDDRITRLPTQPPLERPVLAADVTPEAGWWVTGSDVLSGNLAVSVSHDQGRSWTTRRLGTPPAAADAPAVTSADGRTGYVFVHTAANAVIALRTTDSGQSWRELVPPVPHLPAHLTVSGSRVGCVLRPDGSVLLWVEDGTAPMYLESADGTSFHGVSGPGGRVVAVGGGYALVSTPPAISRDARTWTPVPVPAFLPPG